MWFMGKTADVNNEIDPRIISGTRTEMRDYLHAAAESERLNARDGTEIEKWVIWEE